MTSSSRRFLLRLRAIVLAKERQLMRSLPDESLPALPGVRPRLPRGMAALRRHYNVLAWPDPACAELAELFRRGLALYGQGFARPRLPEHLTCWAHVARRGERLDWHEHAPPSAVAGNFCVDAGDPAPRVGGTTRYRASRDRVVVIKPRAGQLVLFRGDVAHQVTPYRGSRPRISIAFTALVAPPRGVELVRLLSGA